MTAETGFVLPLYRLSRIFSEGHHATDALATARGDMIAARTVAVFASSLLSFVARIEEKNFPHHGGREFLKGGCMTGFANFVADIGGWTSFSHFLLGC
jgi:hypothetical protein